MQKSTYFDQTTTQQESQTKIFFQARTNYKQLAARAVMMTEFHVRTNIAAQVQKVQIVLWETRSFFGKTFTSFY